MDELLIHNAEEKLKREAQKVTGREAGVIKNAVITALMDFSRQDKEFAQAIIESSKSFSECMKKVTENCGNCLSDIEAYRRAVQFYFPGADIKFNMSINLCASAEKNEMPSILNISLMDLL